MIPGTEQHVSVNPRRDAASKREVDGGSARLVSVRRPTASLVESHRAAS